MIPDHIKTAIDNWVLKGKAPGGFTTAVLQNDLLGAIKNGDPESIASLRDIIDYMIGEIPAPCWGSKDKMSKWASVGGQKGMYEARQRATLLNLE